MRSLTSIFLSSALVLGSSVARGQVDDGAAERRLEAVRAEVSAEMPEVAWVNVVELRRSLQQGEPVVLVDAREEAEFRVSHLQGARRVDPDDLEAAVAALADVEREARVVVYCSVGWRSGRVVRALGRAGFRHALNLVGGIFAWGNAGYPVYRGGRRVRAIHPFDRDWGSMLDPALRAYR